MRADRLLSALLLLQAHGRLTGRDDVDTRLEGMQSGVSEFLAKPVTRHELLARVRAQLHILDLTRQLEQIETNLQQRTGAAPTASR